MLPANSLIVVLRTWDGRFKRGSEQLPKRPAVEGHRPARKTYHLHRLVSDLVLLGLQLVGAAQREIPICRKRCEHGRDGRKYEDASHAGRLPKSPCREQARWRRG